MTLAGCGPAITSVAGEDSSGGEVDTTGDPPAPDPTGEGSSSSASPGSSTGLPPGGDGSTGTEPTDTGTQEPPATDTGEERPEPIQCTIGADDCPRGFKCLPATTGGWNFCSEIVARPAGLGEPCMTLDDSNPETYDTCDAGLICFPEGRDAVCNVLCGNLDMNQAVCGEDEHCIQYGGNGNAICSSLCDPLLQDCTEDGEGCYWTGGEDVSVCARYIEPERGGGVGAACDYVNACAPGQTCVGGDAAFRVCRNNACCTPYCDLTQPDTCARIVPGSACEPLLPEDEMPDNPALGTCSLVP